MMATTDAALLLVGVSLLWGVTNPLMKKGSVGIEAVKGSNFIFQFFGEVRFLMFNWKYLFPFLLNQSGSLIYYWTLGNADLSMAVIFTNSLTFIFTTIADQWLGNTISNKSTYIGIIMVTTGVALCTLAKAQSHGKS